MLTIALLLTHSISGFCEGKSFLEQQGITEYELVHFDLNELNASRIIAFNFNGQLYKVQLEENENILPIINGQVPTKIDQIWYV